MLGAKSAISELSEAYGLFQTRFLLRDYVASDDEDTNLRNDIIRQVRMQEGFTIERAGLLLQHLPPNDSIPLVGDPFREPAGFIIPEIR